MQTPPLPLFGAHTRTEPPRFQRRGIPGFASGDRVRWHKPQPPSHALTGKVIGFTQRCTRLVIRTADDLIVTLAPADVINTTRTPKT